jgi:hypothetical protein
VKSFPILVKSFPIPVKSLSVWVRSFVYLGEIVFHRREIVFHCSDIVVYQREIVVHWDESLFMQANWPLRVKSLYLWVKPLSIGCEIVVYCAPSCGLQERAGLAGGALRGLTVYADGACMLTGHADCAH